MRPGHVNVPASGAYADLNELIALRFPAQQLQLSRQKRALNLLVGPNKTNFRGRGIDFEEVRAYQSGDDIRTIDWRVTARTGNAHTRLFREERERPVLVVLDQRSSMFFGSTCCCKSVLAAHLASLLAWSALNNGDRVGGLVFDDTGHQEIRPRRNRRTVLSMLSEFCRYNRQLPCLPRQAQHSFADMLDKLRRIARPGSSLFLVSDFRGAEGQRAREHLYELAKHTELTALKCTDPLETELPRAGTYAVTDGTARSELDTADRQLAAGYRDSRQRQHEALSRNLQRMGIPLLAASTDAPPFALLQTYYGDPRR